MEGDTLIEKHKCFSETSTVSSCTSETNNIRVKKHVAVIETSSDSEDEEESIDFDLSVMSFACSGDSEYLVEAQSLALKKEFKIKNSHCAVIPDSDCDSIGLSNIKISADVPKFVHQLDWQTWAKKKKEEEKRKKLEEELRAQQKDELHSETVANSKSAAWVNWMCKKKEGELKKQINDIEARRREKSDRDQRQIIAQQKFEEWFKKKKRSKKDKPGKHSEEEETIKLQKKLTKLKKWEDWYNQKKTVNVPKSFTHMNYPKPTWVNPVPWCHPDPSSDCAVSICNDSD